jgi:hypothetical protein
VTSSTGPHLRALGVSRVRQPLLAARRRLAGEEPLPSRGVPARVDPGRWGIDPARPERVVVVAAATAALFDGLVAAWPPSAVLVSPPVTFGALAGVELGRGLDAEGACWARQLLTRLGPLPDLATPAGALDPEARLRLVLARTLARRAGWTLLEDPLRPVPAGRARRMAEVVAAAVEDRGLIVLSSRAGMAGWFGARETRPPATDH